MTDKEKIDICKVCEYYFFDSTQGITYCKFGKKMIGWYLSDEEQSCPKGKW